MNAGTPLQPDANRSTTERDREVPSSRRPDGPGDGPPAPLEGAKARPRGFAAMNRALVCEIAHRGGKAAHAAGTAHQFSSDEARVAGRKGGRATHAKRRQAREEQRDVPPAAPGGGRGDDEP